MRPAKRVSERRERWVAWDTEAVDWTRVVAACAVDERGEAIVARSIQELLATAQSKGWLSKDTVWWAHYGGRYDHRLVLDALDPREWSIERLVCDARGAWSVDLRHQSGAVWKLRDSYCLLPVSLRKLGEIFGRSKFDVDRSRIDALMENQVLDYCLNDARVLMHALLSFERLWRWGPVQTTLAATSTYAARLQCVPRGAWGWRAANERLAEQAYYGGRTEVFRRELGAGRGYDLRSAYPWAMTQPLPTRARSFGRWEENSIAIVNARVRVNSDYPLLPVRLQTGPWKGKLLFPIGEFDGWWTSEELRHGVESGEVRLIKVHRALNFDGEPWLAPYISELFELRQRSTDPGMKFVAKVALNSISGKFIETPEHEYWTTGNEREVRTASGIWSLRKQTQREYGAFRFSACAAFITARARIRLWEAYRALIGQGARVAYSDTDSVYTDGVLPTGPELGDWDQACEFERAEFVVPKLYAYWHDGKINVRSKGFRRITAEEEWRSLLRGEPVVVEGFCGLGDGLRRGDITMTRTNMVRCYRGDRFPKRCFLPDGSSRPWDYSELVDD